MQIKAAPPFELSTESDGSRRAISGDSCFTFLQDLGTVDLRHRVGKMPVRGSESRWLVATLEDCGGVKIYCNRSNVIVTKKEFNPSFELQDPQAFVEYAMKLLDVAVTERGTHTPDTANNRQILQKLVELVSARLRTELLAEIDAARLQAIDKGAGG